ncbi:hypothetical protein PORY_001628 [Pneumocystis oryctolagi]|uniref:Uncharacterized protein n=1 Tax=Pneumocystis oryctolagi TaxID=42067 RepID=A0ACB7CDB5_9ASCO|nr:hypothetical protein PORY_001628 [Pneumocystis oryctolagi]
MAFNAAYCTEPPIFNIKSTTYLNVADSAAFLSGYLQTATQSTSVHSSLHENTNGSFEIRMALQNAGVNAQLYKILQHLETYGINHDVLKEKQKKKRSTSESTKSKKKHSRDKSD